ARLRTERSELLMLIQQIDERFSHFESLNNAALKSMTAVERATNSINHDLTSGLQDFNTDALETDSISDIRAKINQRVNTTLRSIEDHLASEQSAFADVRAVNRQLGEKLIDAQSEVEALRQQLHASHQQQRIDELTAIANRRAYEERIAIELSRHRRSAKPLVYALWDIDHFKNINDRHGHPAGDAVLKLFAAMIHDSIRESDFIARIGGEEFVLILPETNLSEGQSVCEKIRQDIAGRNYRYEDENLTISASCGLCEWHREESSDELYTRADAALYNAKSEGRNRVVCAAQNN
ncbi:MAG: diguanylate cyclase, partial [Pseudomonadota bacterium]